MGRMSFPSPNQQRQGTEWNSNPEPNPGTITHMLLHSPPDYWGQQRCSLHDGCTMPAPSATRRFQQFLFLHWFSVYSTWQAMLATRQLSTVHHYVFFYRIKTEHREVATFGNSAPITSMSINLKSLTQVRSQLDHSQTFNRLFTVGKKSSFTKCPEIHPVPLTGANSRTTVITYCRLQ